METIDLTRLRAYTKETGQPTHPEMLDTRPMEHVTKIEIDEEHITVEFDERTTRYYNANEIVNELTLMYNQARQTSITTELIDIVGGSAGIGVR